MYSTAKFVSIVGFRLKEDEPLPSIVIEFDEGSEVMLREHFFNRHGFKLGDKVIVTISMDNDQSNDSLSETNIDKDEHARKVRDNIIERDHNILKALEDE